MPAPRASSSRSTKPGTTARCCSADRSSGSDVEPRLRATNAAGDSVAERTWPAGGLDHRSATNEIIALGRQLLAGRPVLAFGHRVVHGGVDFAAPARVDADVLAKLARLVPLAPLHQPHNLAPIEAIAAAAPHIPQVACFDTAFHRSQPHVAQAFALPRELSDAGVRRYGFHGLSYDYIVSRLHETAPEIARSRLIIAHLGNGASLCAVQDGKSVASTMGFTAVDGLMMGTRTGSLDPGVLLYLMQERGLDAAASRMCFTAGRGCWASPGSRRTCARCASPRRPRRPKRSPCSSTASCARQARWRPRWAASMPSCSPAGIGENDAATRAEVAAGCRWLGLELDDALNRQARGRISAAGSRISAWVLPTDEERMIARYTSQAVET